MPLARCQTSKNATWGQVTYCDLVTWPLGHRVVVFFRNVSNCWLNSYWQIWRRYAPPFFRYLRKALRGGWNQPPTPSTPPVRGLMCMEVKYKRNIFAIAVQPTIWHISKKTTTRCPQRSRDLVAVSDLTSSCVFRSLTSCQRHTSDPNSLKLTMYSKSMGVYNLYISDFFYIGDLRSCQFRDFPIISQCEKN